MRRSSSRSVQSSGSESTTCWNVSARPIAWSLSCAVRELARRGGDALADRGHVVEREVEGQRRHADRAGGPATRVEDRGAHAADVALVLLVVEGVAVVADLPTLARLQAPVVGQGGEDRLADRGGVQS